MSLLNRFFQLLLSVIVCGGIVSIQAQVLTGTSVILGSKHYYIETGKKANFYQAAIACAKKDMKLVSIENKDEYNRLFSSLKTSEILEKEYWLSATNIELGTTKYTWLGTGKEVTFKHPDPPTANTCLYTDSSFNYASSTTCTTDSHYYICEKSLEPLCGKLGQCRYTYSSASE